jgi:hypothetical protein
MGRSTSHCSCTSSASPSDERGGRGDEVGGLFFTDLRGVAQTQSFAQNPNRRPAVRHLSGQISSMAHQAPVPPRPLF